MDVLVVGAPDADALFDLAEEASQRLRREVDVHRVSVEAWEAPADDPFLASVRERPLVRPNLDLEARGADMHTRPDQFRLGGLLRSGDSFKRVIAGDSEHAALLKL
ncbi:hypothetical protein [Streptacidiphilus cavernicola]|uniref:Universal stress protein n=1 Tax=Streptacidiphilus cavernicola TaxID=3342716 RepID=A0ABV6VUM0_9ACTN